jgi:hypothetical protein
VGGGKTKANGEKEQIWCMHFVSMHENRTMIPVKIVLRSQGGEIKAKEGGDESNQDTM